MADSYGCCDEVWTVSEDAANTPRSYGYKKDITIVQNGTEMRTPSPYFETVARERFGLGEQPILLYVGQPDYKKNLRLLIEAAALLKKQGHAFQLVFAGQDRDKTKLAESAVKQPWRRFIAFLFILAGFWQIFLGDFGGGLWIAFIGWYLDSAAASQVRQQNINDLLAGHRVADAMHRDYTVVSSGTTLEQLVNQHILGTGR